MEKNCIFNANIHKLFEQKKCAMEHKKMDIRMNISEIKKNNQSDA